MRQAVFYRAAELAARGKGKLPPELTSSAHLIYSSPATLSFNSPGAEGFGVKRAALAIPGSVMLLVAPGCCGRNTALISAMQAYHGRFFYLLMDETDIVTGRHLEKIPQAVQEVCQSLPEPPSVVMICITCVDALLGTDLERVCRRAEARVGFPVRPSYMYALTREGRRPPMVHVRQSLYSLLEPRARVSTSANLLGCFAPLQDACELYPLLHAAGVKTIREISRSEGWEGFQAMAEANFNLVLHPEARAAAQELQERLGIASIELARLYEPDRIRAQYRALGAALGVTLDDQTYYDEAVQAVERFRAKHPGARISVGETVNADPAELALALARLGFQVPELFSAPQEGSFVYLRALAACSPDTRIYSNMDPTMLYYDPCSCPVDATIGKDAGYYHQDAPNVPWNEDRQYFGYSAVTALFAALERAMEGGGAS